MKTAILLALMITCFAAADASAQSAGGDAPTLEKLFGLKPEEPKPDAPKAAVPKPKVAKPIPPKIAGVAQKTPLQDPGAVFAGLTGSCWQAPLDQGNTDTHCFTAAFNGKLVLDVHKVRNASQAVVYEGVTVYRPDARTRSLAYEYSNSFGNLITGQGWRAGAEINFSSQSGQLAKAETIWRLTGDGYEVRQADPKAAKLNFRKSGTAGDGL